MKNIKEQFLIYLFTIGLISFSAPAWADAIFMSPDTTQTYEWIVPTAGESLPVNLNAIGSFHAYDFTNYNGGTRVRLDITINNLTDLTLFPGTNAGITMFGMQVAPDTTAYWDINLTQTTSSSGTFKVLVDGNGPNQTAPGGYNSIDVCVEADGSNCGGGSQNLALSAGSSTSLTMYLFFVTPDLTSFTFGDMPLMFQSTWGSFHPNGCVDACISPPPTIPEPESTLFIFAALGFMRLLSRRL